MLISLKKARDLDLSSPTSAGRPAHLSAASGLVRAGRFLYVIADDELHLGIFRSGDVAPGRWMRVFDGELPEGAAERKARKPDLEALARLPPFSGYPHGALLAIASGSTAGRRKGALISLGEHSEAGALRECDFSGVFSELETQIAALNIEGAFTYSGELCFLQRGSRRSPQNLLIRYELAALLEALESGARLAPKESCPLELGTIDGIALAPTDGAILSGGDFVFCAVAEDTEDTYRDGPCVGAALGIAGRDGRVRALHRLDRPYKIEGIEATVEGDAVHLLLVTDADDAATIAALYSASIPATRAPARAG